MCYVRQGIVMNRTHLNAAMSEGELSKAIADCLCEDPAVSAEEWLTACVAEVFADKCFIPVEPGMTAETIAEATYHQLCEFFATSRRLG